MDELQRAENQQGELTHRQALPDDQASVGAPYTINEAIVDAIEQVTGEPFPDPFTDEHEIEYWLWTGSRLVPASPDVEARLRQQELYERELRQARQKQRQPGILSRLVHRFRPARRQKPATD